MGIKESFLGRFQKGGEETTWTKTPSQAAESPETGKKGISGLFRGRSKKENAPVDLGPNELAVYEEEQHQIKQKLEKAVKQRAGIARIMKHPLKFIFEKPVHILIVTIPAALIIFLLGTAFVVKEYGMGVFFNSTLVDDIVVLSILVVIVPLAILDFKESQRIRHLEEALPNFFRDLAGMNDSGMTLPNAVHLVAQSEYSTLTPYIRRLDNEMSWNVTFIEAVQRFRVRLATPLTDRSIDLIAKASKAGGDVSEVLRAAAYDTYEFIQLSTERRNNMLIYVVIVLISFVVFVFVIYILVSTFLSTMAAAGSKALESGGAAASFIGAVDLFFYERIFSHAAMIQGLFSGLMAGQMGESRAIAGLKYSAIMLIIAWVVFRFFIS